MIREYEYPGNRVDFKILAAKWCLERLEVIDNKAGGTGHFQTQVMLDCILSELIGAKDAAGLGLKGNNVLRYDAKVKKLQVQIELEKKNGSVKTALILGDILGLYSSGHWLNQLREYRNFSAHENILPRAITWSSSEGMSLRFRLQDPKDTTKGVGPEIVPWCEEIVAKMEALVAGVRKQI